MAGHDLESLFSPSQNLCAVSQPTISKHESRLTQCFDLYFNTFELSILKTVMIQSQFDWTFHPSLLSALLNTLWEQNIQQIKFKNNSFYTSSVITHDEMSKVLIKALHSINNKGWVQNQPTDNPDPQTASKTESSSNNVSGQSKCDDSSELSDASLYIHSHVHHGCHNHPLFIKSVSLVLLQVPALGVLTGDSWTTLTQTLGCKMLMTHIISLECKSQFNTCINRSHNLLFYIHYIISATLKSLHVSISFLHLSITIYM
ncbi:hypothetical protein JVT61DRAFT_15474 [Boletus reticuloceps]|uniref:Uncharacterized protein n=1 Tax=Boletus reticuloceps TaxID=495285 RepID=A0A8I2YCB7_9AGAM|nr:hypothetical protein JVT61DRAFT_15474 [Boletus reticuloceps]